MVFFIYFFYNHAIIYLQHFINILRNYIMWTTPAATEIRLGMEITAYVMNR